MPDGMRSGTIWYEEKQESESRIQESEEKKIRRKTGFSHSFWILDSDS